MSSNTWKFSELKFPRPDIDAFRHLYEDGIFRVQEARDGDDVLEVVFEYDELARRAGDLLTAAFINYTLDTTNEVAQENQHWVDENTPYITKVMLEFSEALYNSPYKDYIEEKVGPMYFIKTDSTKKTFCEENIPLRKRESELAEEYQKIIASCNVEVNGEPRTFMSLQTLFAHEDRNVRREAFKVFSDFLKQHEERLEEIWDELIKTRTQIGKNLGYDNYLPVGYLERMRLDYGEEEVENFRKQVLDVIVPLCSKLYEAQAKRLGVDKLMVYDEKLVFSDGNAKPAGDTEYMMNQLVEMLRDMSPETGQFIDFMLDHELIDYKSRVGKAAREYATMISSRKAPFIFAHFDGTASDVQFMTDGLGHAFAAYRAARKQPLHEYFSSSADVMEIHSMAMTQFANKYADRLFGEDANKYQFGNLQGLMTFIPFGVAVDEFQHICYKNPDLTPKERTAEWRKLEQKYMPWRKYDDDDEFMLAGGYWYHKVHFFVYPLYYIEYCLATVNAMEMNRKYIERPGVAWKEFLELSDVGGSKTYLEILKLANLSPAYEDGAVEKSISYVKNVLEDYIREEV